MGPIRALPGQDGLGLGQAFGWGRLACLHYLLRAIDTDSLGKTDRKNKIPEYYPKLRIDGRRN